ncbi:hypothetical protein BDV98DRAFT_499232 [Pterulicium gracile]|uniref:Cora-domain-containing protein n=1 Tax=Pterulicium gracile TaxID=1884261 RepID=A0A5C3QWA0_9AGAR|nr:hypothetical protein BDV98DRAFT_499232 [Pterula gracilis]
MPRENSFSDSDGRSLTPDLDDVHVTASPSTYTTTSNPQPPPALRINTDDTHFVSPPHAHAHAHFDTPQTQTQAQSVRSPVRSTRTAATTRTRASRTHITQTPRERFKTTVRKVIQMHRSTSVLINGDIGAEPGVDPRRNSAQLNYGHIHQECVVQVVDYSSVRCSVGRRMGNSEFLGMLNSPMGFQRDPWVKVRWINVGGVSWDLISALAIKYDLHPLAIEDVLHTRDHSRSKADYYSKHLFIRAVCHRLLNANNSIEELQDALSNANNIVPPQPFSSSSPFSSPSSADIPIPRSESPSDMGDEDERGMKGGGDEERVPYVEREHAVVNGVSRKTTLMYLERDAQRVRGDGEKTKAQRAAKNEITLDQLKKEERVPVSIKPMFMFLMRDGTVISMHASPSIEFTAPIAARLQQRDTLLRRSADPSMLLQSILDLIVDQAMEVVAAYHDKIKKFEKQVLLKRKMATVTNLHILSSDLVMHKRTLAPLKTLIYGLRRYDLDRCAALVDPEAPGEGTMKEPVVGYMSHKSKIYLADVHDHAEYIITSLDMFASITENLINYTFNMASYEMNVVMRQLTTATIIFLPLTFLCGYFGVGPPSSSQHNDAYHFWVLAIPVCAVIVPLFMWADIQRGVHYMQKKVLAKKVVRSVDSKVSNLCRVAMGG